MKIGIEVEGRMKGLMTLFCSAEEFYENDVVGLIYSGKVTVSQVYVSDHGGYANIRDLVELGKKVYVTVELTYLHRESPAEIGVILNIKNNRPAYEESFKRLKGTDQIKFEHEMNIFTITKEQMHRTYPSDFAGDYEIDREGNRV